MDGAQYLRDLLEMRLEAVRGSEPQSTALYFYELKGASDALVAADLLDPWAADEILDWWHRTLEAEGFERREAVGFGFHGTAQASAAIEDTEVGPAVTGRFLRADPIDVPIMDVDEVRLVADALLQFSHGFDLQVAFVSGSPPERVDLLKRMTRREWRWEIQDEAGTSYRETEGRGGLGSYTLRFRPQLRDDAGTLTLTVTRESQVIAQVSFPAP